MIEMDVFWQRPSAILLPADSAIRSIVKCLPSLRATDKRQSFFVMLNARPYSKRRILRADRVSCYRTASVFSFPKVISLRHPRLVALRSPYF